MVTGGTRNGNWQEDRLVLQVEAESRPEGLAGAIAGTARDITKLRTEVELVERGTLPNDGKVIDDQRGVEL